MAHLMVLLKWIIILVSLSCSIYQSYDITKRFLGGEVLTELRIEVPETVTFPAFTLAFPITALLNYTKLQEKYPYLVHLLAKHGVVNESVFDESVRKMYEEEWASIITNNLTIKEIFEASYNFSSMFNIGILPSPESAKVTTNKTEIASLCRVQGYVRSGNVHFTINCFQSDRKFKFDDLMYYSLGGTLILIRLSPSITKRTVFVNLFMHEQGTLIRGTRMAAQSVPSHNQTHIHPLSYRKTTANLLPAPYETKCRNYKEEGFESRLEKIDECESKLALARFGRKLYRSVHQLNEDVLLLDEVTIPVKETRKITEECKQESSEPDCQTTIYTPVAFPVVPIHDNASFIVVKVSREPEVTKTCEPKTPFTEYLTLVCSVFGFWFGFSVTGGLIVALSAATNDKLLDELKSKHSLLMKRKQPNLPQDKTDEEDVPV